MREYKLCSSKRWTVNGRQSQWKCTINIWSVQRRMQRVLHRDDAQQIEVLPDYGLNIEDGDERKVVNITLLD